VNADATLSFLADKHAIEQIYMRYCDLVDHKEFERMDEVFCEDVVSDYTKAYGPEALFTNLRPVIERMQGNLGPGSYCGATHHNVCNFRIQVDGDTALSKVHYYAVHRGLGKYEGALYSMWGEYDDQLVRLPVGWRVKHRKYSIFLSEGPVVCARPE